MPMTKLRSSSARPAHRMGGARLGDWSLRSASPKQEACRSPAMAQAILWTNKQTPGTEIRSFFLASGLYMIYVLPILRKSRKGRLAAESFGLPQALE